MPRNGSGNYTLPAGNPVVSGADIEASWANDTLNDVGLELKNSLDRNGRGAMLAPLKIVDGTVTAPGFSFNSEPNSGFYRNAAGDIRLTIQGVNEITFTPSTVTFASAIVATSFSGSLNGSQITTGTVPRARLGTGTANNTTFLRGDGTWAAGPAGGGFGTVTSVDVQAGGASINDLSISGGPITGAGVINIDFQGELAAILAAKDGSESVGFLKREGVNNWRMDSTVDLVNDVVGNLPVSNLNGGTGATINTFWRGNGTWGAAPVVSVAGKTGTITLVKADVGLSNVDNTTDAAKPVSTAQQTALNLKANLASPAFTGTPTIGGIAVGFRDVPRNTVGIARGECFATAAGFTLNTASLAAGYTYTVYNNSAAAITITQGAGVTLRLAGTVTTGNRTLAARGIATIWCNSTTEAVISGPGVT